MNTTTTKKFNREIPKPIPVKRHVFESGTGYRPQDTNSEFIGGPIPLDWVTQAFHLPGKSGHVGIALWFLHGVTKSLSFAITRKIERIAQCHRHTLYAALDALEDAGLIKQDKHQGRRTRVTLIPDVPREVCVSSTGTELGSPDMGPSPNDGPLSHRFTDRMASEVPHG